jgi:uncharacterized protein
LQPFASTSFSARDTLYKFPEHLPKTLPSGSTGQVVLLRMAITSPTHIPCPEVPESSFHAQLQTLLRQHAQPEEKFGHQPRLYALTRIVGVGSDYDDDIVCAAAYLHDLGVFSGHRPEDPKLLSNWDHVSYAAEKSPAMLQQIHFPEAKVPSVIDAIETHQPKDVPRSLEGIILRDADILEQLGAIGILRTICKVGRDTRFPTFTPAVGALQRTVDTLPGKITLATTMKAAEPRIALLRAFLAGVQSEASGMLY